MCCFFLAIILSLELIIFASNRYCVWIYLRFVRYSKNDLFFPYSKLRFSFLFVHFKIHLNLLCKCCLILDFVLLFFFNSFVSLLKLFTFLRNFFSHFSFFPFCKHFSYIFFCTSRLWCYGVCFFIFFYH